jgi:succinate dehydrogenase / fumarate reductase flavoprotein subunit
MPVYTVVTANAKPAVLLNIFRQPDSNTVMVANGIHAEIQQIRKDFWKDLKVSGSAQDLNQEIERAGRVSDFIDLGELLARDALHREESCGGHFRVEHQTEEGETKRNDGDFAYAAAWQYAGEGAAPVLNKDELTFEYDIPSSRSYK